MTGKSVDFFVQRVQKRQRNCPVERRASTGQASDYGHVAQKGITCKHNVIIPQDAAAPFGMSRRMREHEVLSARVINVLRVEDDIGSINVLLIATQKGLGIARSVSAVLQRKHGGNKRRSIVFLTGYGLGARALAKDRCHERLLKGMKSARMIGMFMGQQYRT